MALNYFHFSGTGKANASLGRTSLENHIRQSLRSALLTHLGERPAHPELGSELLSLLYKPLSPSLQAEIQNQVRACATRAEPRIILGEVKTFPAAKGKVSVVLRYQIQETHKYDELRLEINPRGAV